MPDAEIDFPVAAEREVMDTSAGRRSVSTMLFIACGAWLVALGLYFMLVRTALLPEDVRYIGTSLREVHSAVPGMERWLHRVFTVMGGFIASAGVLTIFVAKNELATRARSTSTVLALVGLLSVGTMSATNFALDSDFKWLLLLPAILWVVGLGSRLASPKLQ